MTVSQPRITIGMPVYNGGADLRSALDSLAAQTANDVEIIISDNASTDGSSDLCREFARRHPHVIYIRQTENIGALANFCGLLPRARGQYFMWAAHDDTWPANYVSSLACLLDAHPSAILATAAVEHFNPARTHKPDRPAPGTGRFDNAKVFLEDDACTWIYGLFRSDWLRQTVGAWVNYPAWRGDLTWLFEMLLTEDVVGTTATHITKKAGKGGYRPATERDRMAGWIRVCRDLTRVCKRSTTGWDRLRAYRLVWYYCYRKYLRRGNPIGTTARIVKVLAMAAYFRAKYGPLVESTPVSAAGAGASASVSAATRKAA